jgi:hypothetical protein
MKKFSFVALFAIVAFGIASAAATTQNGTVGLTGTVAETFTLVVPAAFSHSMDDTANAVNTWTVGDVKVTSNVKAWTVGIASAGLGNLINSADNTEKVQYTVTLGSLGTDQSLSSAWTSAAQARTAKGGNTYPLSIKFTAAANTYWQAGTYTDTLTVTISHN